MAVPATVPAEFRVYRSDPNGGAPSYRTYRLDLAPHTPVLTALLRIRSEIDPSLTLRYSCRSAICGSCAMVINSKSRLACQTQVGPELAAHGRITVDPLRNLPVLRDLVVETSSFWGHYKRLEPHLIPDPEHPMPEGKATSMTPAQVAKFQETPRCIACAACYSACPMVEHDAQFPGPMALAKLYRFVVDPRDGASRERLLKIQPDGLWLCLRCHLCTEACPKDVRPSERIMDLKEMAIQAQGATEAGSRHAVAFKENLKARGLLHEQRLVRDTYSIPELLAHIPYGLKVARKKPETLKAPRTIEGQSEVQKIYEVLDEPKEGS